MIKITNVSKTYVADSREVKALNNVNVELPDRGMAFILGKSGSGKTTLLNMMGGFNKADAGKIHYIDSDRSFDILNLNNNEQEKYRNLILGYVFQDFNLLENCNVEENIRIALEQQMSEEETDNHIDEKVKNIIKYVDLEGMEKSRISELSGGQIQRVAIARAVAKEPKVILADEPTGNLDYKTGLRIMELLKNISNQCLIVVVTHDESLANMFGDKIISISDGEIVDETDKNDNMNYKIEVVDNISGEKTSEIFNSKKTAMLHMEKIIFKDRKNDINVVCEEIEKKEKSDEKNYGSKKKTNIKLSLKRLLKLAYYNYKDFKIKNIINTIVLGIMFGIMFFLTGLIISDKIYSETKYISENKTKIVLNQSMQYEDVFGGINERTACKSDDISRIARAYISPDNIIESFSAVEIRFEEECYFSDVWIGFEDYTLLCGAKPEKENEICITDFVALVLGISGEDIGSKIYLFDTEFILSGIIKTDYIEQDIVNKIETRKTTVKEEDDIRFIYQKCVCNENVLNHLKQSTESLHIDASDFTSNVDLLYVRSDLVFTSVSNLLEDDEILYGRKPQSPEEIMVSYEFAEKNDMLVENGYECKDEWQFIDIYDSKYNGVYEDRINLYEYFDDFTIVGIVDIYDKTYDTDIVVSDDVFDEVRESYFQKKNDMLVLGVETADADDISGLLRDSRKKGITVDETVIRKIDGFFEKKDNMWYLTGAIITVFATIMLVINISGIFDNVDIHKKNIGIMKALGVKKRCVREVFYIQTGITCMCIVIIGIISLGIINHFANVVLNKNVETESICYVGGQNGYLLIMIPVLFLINMFSAYVSMRKVEKIQIITLLKNENN